LRAYECLYIVHPGADAVELDGSTKKYTEIIEGKGGSVRKADIWGRRQLGYPIKNISDGNYVLLRFDAPPEAIADLEFRMRVDDRILRYMTAYEIAEGAGMSDELMALTERKERDRRGRGRGRGRGGGGGGGRFEGRRHEGDAPRGPRERSGHGDEAEPRGAADGEERFAADSDSQEGDD
jgi:small subunit ribosomal protein S6